MTTTRQLLQTSATSRRSVIELLQLLFAAELVTPSRCLWIVSPWIRDVPVIDNSSGGFSSLCPDFPCTEVRLSRVLTRLMERGTKLVIATRPDEENRHVVDAISAVNVDLLKIHVQKDLHAKGIVGDRFCLTGSMNLTFMGVNKATEMIVLERDPSRVEELRLVFAGEYGGLE